jgi:hypothetical protein
VVQLSPDWVTVKPVDAPPVSCTEAFSVVALLVGGIVNVTLPSPVPEAGVAFSPLAVHAQEELVVVTVTVAVPPAALAVTLEGVIPRLQFDPNCEKE